MMDRLKAEVEVAEAEVARLRDLLWPRPEPEIDAGLALAREAWVRTQAQVRRQEFRERRRAQEGP